MRSAGLDVAVQLDQRVAALVVAEGRQVDSERTRQGTRAGVQAGRGEVSGQPTADDDWVAEDAGELPVEQGRTGAELVERQNVGVGEKLLVEDLGRDDECKLTSSAPPMPTVWLRS